MYLKDIAWKEKYHVWKIVNKTIEITRSLTKTFWDINSSGNYASLPGPNL